MASCLSCYAQSSWVQQGPKLIGAVGGLLGFSVALSDDGNTALISEPLQCVEVMVRSAGGWTVQAQLVGAGAIGDAQQGVKVALSGDGNTAAVSGAADNSLNGAVWIFVRSGTTWTGQTKIIGSGAGSQALQGFSVALSQDGNTLIEGSPADSTGTAAAWVFTRTGGLWAQQGPKLVLSTTALGAGWMSASISADGNTAVLGIQTLGNAPAGIVFVRSGGSWVRQGTGLVGPPDGGYAAAISADGNTILLGESEVNQGAGGVWAFIRSGSAWVSQGKLTWTGATAPWGLGYSVALSGDGNTALVGAPGAGVHPSSGGLVYVRSNGIWNSADQLVGTAAVGDAGQGYSVALSADGRTALIGGPFDLYVGGAAWFFVRPAATNTTLSIPNSPIPFETAVVFTATVAPAVSVSGVSPTGTVTFRSGSTSLGQAALSNTGKAVLSPKVTVGTYNNVIATYSGDVSFLGSASSPQNFTVQKAVTSVDTPVLVSGVPDPGQPLTFAASVFSALSGLTGTATFFDGATQIGTSALNSTGTATLTVSSLSAGKHAITAVYGGDSLHLSSTPSPALTITVGPTIASVSATVASTAGLNVVVYGQPVALTATFGLSALGGSGVTATFVDSGTGAVLCQSAPVSNGMALCNIASMLAAGVHTITVTALNGDVTHQLGTVTPLSLTVNRAGTALTFNTAAASTQIALAATLSVVAPGSGNPSGMVQFIDSSTGAVLVSVPVAGGVAKTQVASTTHIVKAVYAGDANFTASSAAQMAPVNAASYGNSGGAADEILVLYGASLTSGVGTRVQVTDAAGNTNAALVMYESAGQINCVLPSGLAPGLGTVSVSSTAGASTAALVIGGVAPGLFSADASGKGVAAANVQRLLADGSVAITNAAAVDASGKLAAAPIDMGSAGDQVFLVLYGTGIRHRTGLSGVSVTVNGQTIPVLYAGLTPGYDGLDQVNVGPLPGSLRGSGVATVVLTVDSNLANQVTLTIQ